MTPGVYFFILILLFLLKMIVDDILILFVGGVKPFEILIDGLMMYESIHKVIGIIG